MESFYRYTLSIKIKDEKLKYEFTTNTIIGGSNLPYQKDLPDINKNYEQIRNNITYTLSNYEEDDF